MNTVIVDFRFTRERSLTINLLKQVYFHVLFYNNNNNNYGFSAYIQVITKKKQDNIVSGQLKANLKLVRLPCEKDYREQAIHK